MANILGEKGLTFSGILSIDLESAAQLNVRSKTWLKRDSTTFV